RQVFPIHRSADPFCSCFRLNLTSYFLPSLLRKNPLNRATPRGFSVSNGLGASRRRFPIIGFMIVRKYCCRAICSFSTTLEYFVPVFGGGEILAVVSKLCCCEKESAISGKRSSSHRRD